MGQKVNPVSARLGYTAKWRSRWFDLKNYKTNLLEDYEIRQIIKKDLRKAAVARVDIERLVNEIVVNIYTARPGMIIGRGGAGVEGLKQKIKKAIGRSVKIDITEVRNPEGDAAVVAHQIVEQIEKRIPFRRAIRGALDAAHRSKIDGIKIIIAGRLNGADIARRELFIHGKVPLHTLRHYIDYAGDVAYTTYGTVGVKVWIFKAGEIDVDRSVPKADTSK
ncbi:30S ribosomal protein S3 [candidate division Kazan bacterium RBG_13_50_9]|uniref:Small ribosomal subunit protein uS3 n=1 Tax=candidate division Kazan bacterium RBG_13_50_9 TaxID=1798535 RepID=A0A1F4NSW0_UNCK3|nr:MAG: 30S ribosomal protein S3 [candidate division Kazan bacterium RBG_13_50_9]